MPRPRSAENETGRASTEAWRARRRAIGRPESAAIDRAIAASFAAFFEDHLLSDRIEVAFRTVVVGARKLLVHQGFDKLEATRELQRRVTRRSDLRSLQRICVDKKTELLPLLQV